MDECQLLNIVFQQSGSYGETHTKPLVNNNRQASAYNVGLDYITKTCLFKLLKILQPKRGKSSDKNSDIFQISAQNINCRYSLEPPSLGGSNEYQKSMF